VIDFGPTGAWDDAVGFGGIYLANRVDTLLDQLKWNEPNERRPP